MSDGFTLGRDNTPQWVPGTPSRRHQHVITTDRLGGWTTEPGYRFSHPDAGDLTTERIPVPNLTGPSPRELLEQFNAQQRAEFRQQIAAVDASITEKDHALDRIRQEMRARTHDIWDSERSINEWLRAGEAAREQAGEIARDLFIDLSKEEAQKFKPWAVKKIPPEQRKKIEKTIDDYTRKGGWIFRKIEPYNPKFLLKAYEVIKNLRDAHQHYKQEEYDQAVGSILDAFNTAFPNQYSNLIEISYKDGRLWIADFSAFATRELARRAADQMSAVQGEDLKAIKSLSGSYQLRVNEKKALIEKRTVLERELHKYD